MDLILALFMMVAMSLSFSLLIAIYVRKRERTISLNAIALLINNLQEALPDLVISYKVIPINKTNNSHPYDWQSEEAFEQIVKRFNN